MDVLEIHDEISIKRGTEIRQIGDSYQPPVYEFGRREKIKQMLTPDVIELELLVLSFVSAYFISGYVDLHFLSAAGLVYTGIVSFAFYALRWGYAGIGHFQARLRMIEKEVAKTGKPKVDFKFIGFIISFLLISIGALLTS